MKPTAISPSQDSATYSIDELSARTDVPVRTIRYYIQRGLVPRPLGEKKGSYYEQAHLDTLLQIRQWIGAGLSLDRVSSLLHGNQEASHETAITVPIEAPLPSRQLQAFNLGKGIELSFDEFHCQLAEDQRHELVLAIASLIKNMSTKR